MATRTSSIDVFYFFLQPCSHLILSSTSTSSSLRSITVITYTTSFLKSSSARHRLSSSAHPMANLNMPDFAAISADHSSIATSQERLALRMRLLSNLPAVEEGNRVIQALNDVTRELNENTQQLAAFFFFFNFKSCLPSIHNLSVMTDPPSENSI